MLGEEKLAIQNVSSKTESDTERESQSERDRVIVMRNRWIEEYLQDYRNNWGIIGMARNRGVELTGISNNPVVTIQNT